MLELCVGFPTIQQFTVIFESGGVSMRAMSANFCQGVMPKTGCSRLDPAPASGPPLRTYQSGGGRQKPFEFQELPRLFCIPYEYLALRQPVGECLETRPELYRRLARECLALSGRMTDVRTRWLFAEMAASWHRLAERADREASDAFRRGAAGVTTGSDFILRLRERWIAHHWRDRADNATVRAG
jgi:hypothetical protein